MVKLAEIIAYHGRKNPNGKFTKTHAGSNTNTFGSFKSTRYGTFFSDNPKFSELYGHVRKYEIDDSNIVGPELLNELASKAAKELDYNDPDQKELATSIGYIAGSSNGNEWELFEDELGEYFVPWLIKHGYSGAQFVEYNDGPDGKIRSLTTVVFDPKIIHAK